MIPAPLLPCWGCGAPVPDVDGPTHAYLGASAGCWAIYTEILARQIADVALGRARLLSVNAYAVQHPGHRERRTAQSVAVHLSGLCLALERDADDATITRRMSALADARSEHPWLEPPASLGELTILDVVRARGADEHAEVVGRWARSAWGAWGDHHDIVRAWLDAG